MADWIRAPKQRWFVNTNWVEYAFEAAKTNSTQWNSYYGTNGKILRSQGLNPDNPQYRSYNFGGTCTLCDLIAQCGYANLSGLLKDLSQWALSGCDDNAACAYCQEKCEAQGGDPALCAAIAEMCNNPTPFIDCSAMSCLADDPPPYVCSTLPDGCNISSACLDRFGNWVPCDHPDSVCNPAVDSDCEGLQACPCGGPDGPGTHCVLQKSSDPCPAVCCIPGEPGCVECVEGSGEWVPEELCCENCGDDCSPFGYPMPDSYCQSCEYCNFAQDAEHCDQCCRCNPTGPFINCADYDELCNNPTQCADFGSNCYECNGDYIPIWFECEEQDPCPNPFNPDCTTGEEIVCYDYNTNDPIYYNASNLGATVIIEYDNPVAGSSYSYGNVATLCEVPDSLQLCVYGVASDGTKTLLVYNTDFTINESLGQITLDASLNVSGYTKVRFERCSDDKKMFLTFSEGSKLSATDINASLHQLLFLIQEKEFASNTYYQVENDDGQGNALFTVSPPTSLPINFDLATTNQNDVLAWDGNGSFVGQDPSVVAGNMQLDNLSNVVFTSTGLGDFLYYNGTNWINSDFETQVKSVVNVYDFNTFESYKTNENASLDDYYYTGGTCDADFDTQWALAGDCVNLNVPKDLIPNAITAFGLGYQAAERQIAVQVSSGNENSDLQTYVTTKIANTLQSGGTILSNIRWELNRTEGRDITSVSGYPFAYFDVLDFATLNHGTDDVLDSESNPPLTSGTGSAYYNAWTSGTCTACRNKLMVENIDTFKFNADKSGVTGLGDNNGSGTPTEDRYLEALRSIVTKKDWGSALGYTESHPLRDYPNTEGNAGTTSYLEYMGSDSLIYGDYSYSSNTDASKNVPAVVTYYLAQLWDQASGAPNYIVWDGNIDLAGEIDASGISTTVSTYLGATGNYWYYWRWWVTGYDSSGGTNGSATENNVGYYDTLSYYNPFNPVLLNKDGTGNDDAKYTILPASEQWDGDYTSDADDFTMAKTGSGALKIDANRVFSSLGEYMGDMYDEYVFVVELDTDARITTTNCPDANCYEVVTNIEKYIDGCEDGSTDCFQVGSGGTNSAGGGYHVYPTDFDDNVVRVWDAYPYEKLHTEVRNKTGASFELVLKVPRMKRIGLIDVWKSENEGADGNFRQLALDFVTDYDAGHWDDEVGSNPHGATSTKNQPPELQDMHPNHGNTDGGSAMTFDVETAIQFIRLGIPASIRISCYTVSTPQSTVFDD